MLKYSREYINDYKKIIKNTVNLNQIKGKSLLVTGAGGLICSSIIDFLMVMNDTYKYDIKIYAAGRKIEKLRKRFEYWSEKTELHFMKYDAQQDFICDKSFDYIIHGASNANPASYYAEPVETMLANIIGTKNLLEHIRNEDKGRFLYISSSEVYGKKNSNDDYTEDDYQYVDILDSRACYPSSKRAAETMCAAFGEEYGIDSVIVRPGHIYGPTATKEDNRASSQFAKDAAKHKDILMKSTGMQMRSYCYVLDCVSAILSVLTSGKNGEAYNISNKDSVVSIRHIAEEFASQVGKKVTFENSFEAEKLSFNSMENSSLNASKLENLGWKAQFDLKDGVRATLNHMIGDY